MSEPSEDKCPALLPYFRRSAALMALGRAQVSYKRVDPWNTYLFIYFSLPRVSARLMGRGVRVRSFIEA